MAMLDSSMADVAIVGCGWLGLPLGSALIEAGYRVNGTTTRTEKLDELTAAGIQAFPLRAEPKLQGDLSALRAPILIITIPPGRRRNDVEVYYPLAIKRLLIHARRQGLERVLFTSSTGVYGGAAGMVTENTPPRPDTASARALIAVEQLLRYKTDVPATILRLAGLAGPGRHPGRWLAGRQDLPDGDAPVNLVHRDDVLAILLNVMRENSWGQTFNVCADHHPRKRDFYPAAARQIGLEPPTFAPSPTGADYKIVANEKVKQILKYTFKYDDPQSFAY